jgi:hypothetical protein
MAIVGDAGRVEVRLEWGGSSRSKMRPVRVLRDRQEPFHWVQGPSNRWID